MSETPTPLPTLTPEPGVFTLDGSGWSIDGADDDFAGLWTGPNGRPIVENPDLAAKLTDLIGSEPMVTITPPSSHSPERTIYSWSGVELSVPNDQKADSQFATVLTITTAQSGNAVFRTTSGVSVGDPQAQTVDESFTSYQDPDGRTVYLVEADHEVVMADKDTDAWNCVRVTVGTDGTVTSIAGPGGFGNVL